MLEMATRCKKKISVHHICQYEPESHLPGVNVLYERESRMS